MAIASAKAMAKIAIVCTFEAASGFLLIDFTAFTPIQPIEIAGKTVPHAIAATVAHNLIDSASILYFFVFNFFIKNGTVGLIVYKRKLRNVIN